MQIFTTTLGQMAVLFSLIIIGYLLAKFKIVPENSAGVLSRLENWVFIPALVAMTFITDFTPEKLSELWKPFVISFAVLAVVIPLAFLVSRILAPKDAYMRNIYTYGLCFSNFGFMGYAVVGAVFPEYSLEYIIFTLPLWTGIFLWGAPSLLMSEAGEKQTIGKRLKAICNPMFIAMVIGIIIGLSGLVLPDWVTDTLTAAKGCMSPLAMILTGITVASTNLKKVFADYKIYLISAARLLLFPAIGLVACYFLPLPESTLTCILCSVAMPLGLNTIVIPAGYGKDTTAAAGMAIVSHILSCITIPVVLMIFERSIV